MTGELIYRSRADPLSVQLDEAGTATRLTPKGRRAICSSEAWLDPGSAARQGLVASLIMFSTERSIIDAGAIGNLLHLGTAREGCSQAAERTIWST